MSKDIKKILADAELKRVELETKHGKVDMCILSADNDICIGYFKKATTATKMACIDMWGQSITKSSQLYFKATFLKEESDPRMSIDITKVNEDDYYYLKALDWCQNQIKYASQVVKKK